MSYLKQLTCLPFLLAASFMLFYQVGLSQQKNTSLDGWLQDHVESLGGKAVLMIYKDGKIWYQQSVNETGGRKKMINRVAIKKMAKANPDLKNDFNEHSIIPLASCSKWLSAALVMTFIDDGTLQLQDTIGHFLPVMTQHGKGNITIQQCLTHTTGIYSNGLKENWELLKQGNTMEAVANIIALREMEAKPGTAFHYGSIGLQIAGAILEKITNKSFEQLFQERIAIPCQMRTASFGKNKVVLPAGGAKGSATDYLRFTEMILNKGTFQNKRVLSEKSIDAMQYNYIGELKMIHRPEQSGDFGYGFGEWTMTNASLTKKAMAVTSPGLFGTFPWVDYTKKYCAVLLSYNLQSKGRHDIYTGLKKLVDSLLP
ncbi:MAG: hypothetical protein ABS68_11605 [Niastella sp. SCN 39-18]|nr:beta-lactamase family protein [Sphingobacteriales bacterium]ODT51795.1 MAG: hypothetical protein ABS68_11605 [Niastella sp. SCN 39-18]OJW10112.1 MAG: hypothetical protein BGO53_06145 [Sphingobacteriales bacterium 39-19]